MIEEFRGIVGREATVTEAFNHLSHGRSVVFLGPPGSGKSSLIAACAETMAERRAQSLPMVIPFCNPLKQFVLTIVEKLYRRKLLEREQLSLDWDTLRKRLSREHYRHSVKLILLAFKRYPGIFIGIDDLDTLTPVGRSIILELANSEAILCAAASKQTPTLRRVLYQFQVVQIPPIHDDVMRQLAAAFLDKRGLLVEDRQHFIENIAWKASGNPLALDNMLRYFENEPHIRIEDVRRLTPGAGRREVSLEWVIYSLFALVILLRFVSRATMNKQLYIITSVLVAMFFLLRFLLVRGNRSET